MDDPDRAFAGGRPHRVVLGDPRAVYRYFIALDGTRRVADLKPGHDRRVEPELLAAQLRAAGYAARERFVPPADVPGRAGSGLPD